MNVIEEWQIVIICRYCYFKNDKIKFIVNIIL